MNHGKILCMGAVSLFAAGLIMAPLLIAQAPVRSADAGPGPMLGSPLSATDRWHATAPLATKEAENTGKLAIVEEVMEEVPKRSVVIVTTSEPEKPIPENRSLPVVTTGVVEIEPLPVPQQFDIAPPPPPPNFPRPRERKRETAAPLAVSAPLPPVRNLPEFTSPEKSAYTGIVLVGGAKEQPPGQPATPGGAQTADASTQQFFSNLLNIGKDAPRPSSSGAPESSVSGPAGLVNGGTGAGDLLAKSNAAVGVEVQRRSPLVGDPRIEGLHFGQIITQADGGYWFPARVDLDTVVSKLNADSIKNIHIIKGPFSVRYGPGFSFLDIESLPTPRFNNGYFEAKGSTGATYRTNAGQQVQQNIWGGSADWGFRLSYDGQSANDYTSGNGTKLPSGYNNQFVNFAYGIDLSKCENIEVKYLHVTQSGVIFPGLLTDINRLTTDAFTGRFTAIDGAWYDRFVLDTWVNATRFNGDSANQGTRNQIPQLDNIFPSSIPSNIPLSNRFGNVRLDITTGGDALSYGAREITTWGAPDGFNVSLGADIRVFTSNYNEFESFNFSVARGSTSSIAFPANFGIPNARMVDPGLFLDASVPYGDNLVFKLGVRADFASTQFLNFGPNVDQDIYNRTVPNAQGTKDFFMYSGFASSEYKLSDAWSVQSGYGYAQRPPTLTELYTGGAFLGLIQNGLNSVFGNPNLLKEQMHQLDLNIKAKYDTFRAGGHAFYSFAPDYITYANQGLFSVAIAGAGTGTTPINKLQFINTRLATIYGFDAYGEHDTLPWLTPFATLSFVEGWDQRRNEALPGIAPLSSRVGFRVHEAGENQRWGVEYFARMVADQNLFAASLGEQRTGGFVIHNLRAYWQARENILVLGGVENIGNIQYREHLDLRTGAPVGTGVFQPGVNFYVGTKITY